MCNKGKCVYACILTFTLLFNLKAYAIEPDVVNGEISEKMEFPGVPTEIQEILELRLKNPQPKYTDQEILILNKIAVAEARTQGVKGMALVMQTVLNRVESDSFPDSIAEVVFAPSQFTPVTNGAYDKAQPNEESNEALERIQEFENYGQLFFESVSCEGTWASKAKEEVYTYKGHRFYK